MILLPRLRKQPKKKQKKKRCRSRREMWKKPGRTSQRQNVSSVGSQKLCWRKILQRLFCGTKNTGYKNLKRSLKVPPLFAEVRDCFFKSLFKARLRAVRNYGINLCVIALKPLNVPRAELLRANLLGGGILEHLRNLVSLARAKHV